MTVNFTKRLRWEKSARARIEMIKGEVGWFVGCEVGLGLDVIECNRHTCEAV